MPASVTRRLPPAGRYQFDSTLRPFNGRWRPISFKNPAAASLLVALLVLGGCAQLAPEGDLRAVRQTLAERPLVGDARPQRAPDAASQAQVEALLSRPLDAEGAVRIALAHGPRMQAAFAQLQLSDAQRVQAQSLPNPMLAFGRLREGRALELDRLLSFDVLGLIALPWRARAAGARHEQARLTAAEQVLQLAADTRRAWLQALTAEQGARYLREAAAATEAGATLAGRMRQAGNWSRLRAGRQELLHAEAATEQAQAEQAAQATREQLVRLLGLEPAQAERLTLPEHLPALPPELPPTQDVLAQALASRLDLRAARADAAATADALGLTRATRIVNGLELGVAHNSSFANDGETPRSTQRGWELQLPLPLFDWGQARGANAEARYMQAAARVRATGLAVASETRQAQAQWRSAWQQARQQQQTLRLRRELNDEMVLRYNAMAISAWELLAESRATTRAVHAAMRAQRDFWLADVDLQMALSGSSPAGRAALQTEASAAPSDDANNPGH